MSEQNKMANVKEDAFLSVQEIWLTNYRWPVQYHEQLTGHGNRWEKR